MQFSAILTSIILVGSLVLPTSAPAYAQGRDNTRANAAILDMAQAYKMRDKRRLAQLLPQTRGFILEPWGAYFELSARLDEASTNEIQGFLTRYAGSYQEDRLRNDWLLQLGRNRDWVGFNREYPLYRMGDDRSVQCYALLADYLATGNDITTKVQELWLALKDPDEGCTAAANQLIKDHSMLPHVAWQRARLGMENDRLRIATQAVELLNPDWVKTVNSIYLNPGKYLNDKLTALRPQTRELVSLALIRQAYLDPAEAATEVEKLRWRAQLTQEERSWIWGVIGKRATQKQSSQAVGYFSRGTLAQMHEDHAAWAVRAALRAGRWSMVTDAASALSDTQRNDPTWIYWQARALL